MFINLTGWAMNKELGNLLRKHSIIVIAFILAMVLRTLL